MDGIPFEDHLPVIVGILPVFAVFPAQERAGGVDRVAFYKKTAVEKMLEVRLYFPGRAEQFCVLLQFSGNVRARIVSRTVPGGIARTEMEFDRFDGGPILLFMGFDFPEKFPGFVIVGHFGFVHPDRDPEVGGEGGCNQQESQKCGRFPEARREGVSLEEKKGL